MPKRARSHGTGATAAGQIWRDGRRAGVAGRKPILANFAKLFILVKACAYLMQPFVIMQGIEQGLVDPSAIDALSFPAQPRLPI